MKKKFLIVLFVLFLLVVGTIAVLYFVAPHQLKRTIDIVMEYVNKPLPIVGCSLAVIGFTAFKIFSTTSYGKKVYKKAQEETNNAIESAKQLRDEAIAFYEKAEKTRNDTKAVLSEFSANIDKITDNLVIACQTSPNAKIKALAPQFKGEYDDAKEELREKLVELDNDLEKVIEKKPSVEELSQIIAMLQSKVERLETYNGEN